ncbi:MAG: M43 family zinc metalloprotease [Flavobacteriales bacterium]|jgi:PKD repeat protein|nr:M43 family zinc metalloprotease [Flavobacteriales bacterium]
MKSLVLLLLTMFLLVENLAQNHQCGTDEMHQELYHQYPGIHQKIINTHQELEQFTQQFIQQAQSHQHNKSGILYTIPVVFHIIHNYGDEYVSNAQVLDGLRVLNEGFQMRNPDTALLISPFKEIAVDCQIAFKLAQLDPDGNCTNGITRNVDSSTYSGFHNVKDIVHWDPAKYLNIYITAEAASLAGHALVPSAADTIPEWDGIVLQHSYLGDIGTGNTLRSRVIVHEVGHYLNLQHVWGGNNVPNYPYLPVGDAGNCAFDDGVTDTPNTIGNSGQNLNTSTCGSLDNMQNFMEYTYLNSMFTEGQKLRMHAALNSTVAHRNNLWSPSNLIATGIDGNTTICSVDIDANQRQFCAGETVSFTAVAPDNISAYTWSFEGGIPNTSNDSVVEVNYTTPGRYEVKLVVDNGTHSDSIVKTNFIEVFASPGERNALVEGFEWENEIEGSHWFTDPVDDSWEISTSVGKNSNRSVMLSNIDDVSGRKSNFYSKPIDLTHANDLVLSFDYAFAKTDATNTDKMRVYISKNCGVNWVARKTISSANIATVPAVVPTEFIPTENDWENVIINNITSTYYTGEFMVKFEFTAGGGNDVYIDNINLYDPAQVGLEEQINFSMNIYPNPTHGQIQIDFNRIQHHPKVEIYEVSGKKVFNQSFQGDYSHLTIAIASLAKGMYFLQINGVKELLVVE